MDPNNILSRIEALEKWRSDKGFQQVTYPIDVRSVDAINKYFPNIIDEVLLNVGGTAQKFRTLLIKQGENIYGLQVYNHFTRFTADPGSDVITFYLGSFVNDTKLVLLTSDTVPAGLALGTFYYVVSSSGKTCKFSASVGGAAIDITDAGVGEQFMLAYN